MHFSLPSREIIADSIEIMASAHPFDALVLIPNCDKVVPAMLMAALRLNIPAVVVSGGPMLAGSGNSDLLTVFESVGRAKRGEISADELDALEQCACPGCGSCSACSRPTTMNWPAEPSVWPCPQRHHPRVTAERVRLAKTAGMRVMDLLEKGLPRATS
jgi:dihydroxy-acid dehydratase